MQQEEEIELNFRLDWYGRTAPKLSKDDEDEGIGGGGADESAQVAAIIRDQEQQDRVMDYSTRTLQVSLRVATSCKSYDNGNNKNNDKKDDTNTLLDDLLLDCEMADSALMPRTFWMPARGMEPRCSLEQMALDIFRHHTQSYWGMASGDPNNIDNKNHDNNENDMNNNSGAEWWVQIRPSPPQGGRYSVLMYSNSNNKDGNDNDSDQEDLSKEGISFHWDKDEDLRLLMGGTTYIHPHLSTVTYLTSCGAPTLALTNCRIHPLSGEWINKNENENSPIEAFLSWPCTWKHLSFDGRYLHAALPSLAAKPVVATTHMIHGSSSSSSSSSSSDKYNDEDDKDQQRRRRRRQQRHERRVTFLVNIWLHYRPLNVYPFPETMLEKMSGSANFVGTKSGTTNNNNCHQKNPAAATSTTRLGFSFAPNVAVTTTKEQQVPVLVVKNDIGDISSSSTPSSSPSSLPLTTPATYCHQHVWPMGDCNSGETIELLLPRDKEILIATAFGSGGTRNTNIGNSGNCRVTWTDPSQGVKLHKAAVAAAAAAKEEEPLQQHEHVLEQQEPKPFFVLQGINKDDEPETKRLCLSSNRQIGDGDNNNNDHVE